MSETPYTKSFIMTSRKAAYTTIIGAITEVNRYK
jgi:hypothetical protein